jgi:uncharacterized protein (DUF427 family)
MMWQYYGQQRPPFAERPAADQESVWDYPRPPALDLCKQLVEVSSAGVVIASTRNSLRVLETASPPTFYIPPADIRMDLLVPVSGSSFCEWKGAAQYWGLAAAPGGPAVGWSYPAPKPAFAALSGWLCFYPGRIECAVDGERVRPQEGGFYGGWVTDSIVGPWKGAPGTGGW